MNSPKPPDPGNRLLAAETEQPYLPYGRQFIDDADVQAVVEALRSDWLTGGPVVEAFEARLAAIVDAPYAVVCSSATAGLHLSAMAAGLREGAVAIVPAMTFLATANAVRFVGGEIMFADVDTETGLMTAEHFESALDKAASASMRVDAVLPVHYAGQTVPMPEIRAVAEAAGVVVIEDASHALGTSYEGGQGVTPVGSCRDSAMAVFSFHPVKTVTMGEGGAVTTRDAALAQRLTRLRNHHMVRDAAEFSLVEQAFDTNGAPNPWYYEMHELGFNYRASALNCALGLSQLEKLLCFAARRRTLVERYEQKLANYAPTIRALGHQPGCHPVWHLFVVKIDFEAVGLDRGDLIVKLREAGIGSQVHYLPLHRQPYYLRRYGEQTLPGAESLYEEILSLPLHPAMVETDVDYVVENLTQIIRNGQINRGHRHVE